VTSGEGDLPTDLHWLALEMEALYVGDSRGRLVRTREPGPLPAPAFALSRSVHGNLWRFADRLPADLVRALSRLAAREAPLAPGSGLGEVPPPPPERWEAIRRRLADRGVDPEPEWLGPCFRFPARLPVASSSPGAKGDGGTCVDLDGKNASLLEGGLFEWLRDELAERQPVVAFLESGAPVSVAWAARGGGPRPFRAVEAGVETAPAARGRGWARRVVASWARRVRSRGCVPLYSTSWSNRASRGVARSLGLAFIGEHAHLGERPEWG
jgi:GNAT superfamily N-acetyltransferase